MAGLCFWKRQASLSPAKRTQVRPGLGGPGDGVFFFCGVIGATWRKRQDPSALCLPGREEKPGSSEAWP